MSVRSHDISELIDFAPQPDGSMRVVAAGSDPRGVPLMPAGFDDLTAWMAIHWVFSPMGQTSTLDHVVMAWQLANQDRVRAAMQAAAR